MWKESTHQPASSAESRSADMGSPVCSTVSASCRPTGALRELLPGGQVAAAVGVAGHPWHEPTVLEQEDARPLHLAELGELAARGAEQAVHRLGLRGRLDQPEQHLGLRRPALLRPPGPGLGGRHGESGASWRSRYGLAAAAGSTVRTPTTSPSTISGSPCADRMPRSCSSRSAARRPSARASTGRRVADHARRGRARSTAGSRCAGAGARRRGRCHR